MEYSPAKENYISKIQENSDVVRVGNDSFSGLPIETLEYSYMVGDEKYNSKLILPYFNQDKRYYNDIYFQMNGGWGYNNYTKEYTETLSYLYMYRNLKIC